MRLRSLLLAAALGAAARAADWPQYRGPNHDGATPERILTRWPAEGPRLLWRVPLGPSFGSFAVSGGRAFVFIQRAVAGADREVAVALDAETGRELWARELGPPTYDKQGGDGPRSTPTVRDGRVYLLGAHLTLSCLDAATGAVLWQHNLVKEFNGQVLRWNSAASPVLDGDRIFVNAGGPGQAFLAFDARDGRLIWKRGQDKPTHATPVPATIHGVRQIIFFTQSGLVSLDAEGRELWRYPFPYQTSTAASPVVWEDMVYCSAGYGVGAGAVQVLREGDRFSVKELWRHPGRTMSHWSTPVCKDGYLYALIGFKEFGTGPLKCIELATGAEKWSQPGFGSGGATVRAGEHVLVQSDRGPLVLVEARPDAYREVARAQVLGGKCWTAPAISNGRLYARNTKEGVCLDVRPQ